MFQYANHTFHFLNEEVHPTSIDQNRVIGPRMQHGQKIDEINLDMGPFCHPAVLPFRLAWSKGWT